MAAVLLTFNQIVISSVASTFDDGKNQKYSSLAFGAEEIGSSPA